MEIFDAFIVIFGSGIRLGVPLILACLAGLWSERSGVVDIGLEGKMLGRRLRRGGGRHLHRQRLGRAGRRRLRDDRRLADPRLRLDRPARQPDRLGHRDQHGRRRHDGADRQRDLVAGRADAATAGQGAVQCDRPAFRGEIRRACRSSGRSTPPDLRPRHRHLFRLRAGAADLLGALQHALRLAPARGRRESGGGRHRRHFGARAALQRGRHLRRAGRASPASISRSPRPPISSRI